MEEGGETDVGGRGSETDVGWRREVRQMWVGGGR